MKKMSVNSTKQSNGGKYHCDCCGWNTWGWREMQTHQLVCHSNQVVGRGKSWKYHYHWWGKYNCYSSC